MAKIGRQARQTVCLSVLQLACLARKLDSSFRARLARFLCFLRAKNEPQNRATKCKMQSPDYWPAILNKSHLFQCSLLISECPSPSPSCCRHFWAPKTSSMSDGEPANMCKYAAASAALAALSSGAPSLPLPGRKWRPSDGRNIGPAEQHECHCTVSLCASARQSYLAGQLCCKALASKHAKQITLPVICAPSSWHLPLWARWSSAIWPASQLAFPAAWQGRWRAPRGAFELPSGAHWTERQVVAVYAQ